MTQQIVLTLLGDDRPGLVEQVAVVIAAHGGNWSESSMAQLAGKFAGILKVELPTGREAALQAELDRVPRLKVILEAATAGESGPGRSRKLNFSLVAHDRVGIVREISQVFAKHGVNVERLETYTSSAPMSSELLFHAEAELKANDGLDARALQADLERISSDLIADINLDERIR